jgi:hypothetical protein
MHRTWSNRLIIKPRAPWIGRGAQMLIEHTVTISQDDGPERSVPLSQ